MNNKNLFKIIISIILCLSVITLGLFSFAFHTIINSINRITDENTIENPELVMDIQTQPYYHDHNRDNHNTKDICYYSLTTDGKANETEPFTPDEMEIFSVPVYQCFEWYSIEFENKNYTYISEMILKDEDGNDVEITPIISDIFKETLAIDHDIFAMKIFKVDDEYFMYAELNVNLWYPCTLYYYNQEMSRLVELYNFDDEEIIGIKIHNLASLNKKYYY